MPGDFVRGGNWPMLVVAVLVTALLTAVGARMVWQAEKVTIARNKVYREIASRRQLVRERDELMRRVAEMKAATRLEIRARMLDLSLPEDDRVIFVGPEGDKR
ncbi:MAG TPA: hypothetical protein PLB35_02940 [Myxococcota bacterium]|nr:hypothetical protein [Myxococcota bacterium]HOH76187.1 hypothetical protein [Myxococcota bacterium]